MWESEWVAISLSRIFFPREGQTVFEKVKFNFFSAFSGPSGITFRVFCATAKRPASSRATPDCRSGPVTLFSYTCFERQTWTHSCEQNSTKFKNDSTLSISFVIECIFLTMIKHWFFQGIQTANRSGRVWTAATASRLTSSTTVTTRTTAAAAIAATTPSPRPKCIIEREISVLQWISKINKILCSIVTPPSTTTIQTKTMLLRPSVCGLVAFVAFLGCAKGQFSDYRTGFLVQVGNFRFYILGYIIILSMIKMYTSVGLNSHCQSRRRALWSLDHILLKVFPLNAT